MTTLWLLAVGTSFCVGLLSGRRRPLERRKRRPLCECGHYRYQHSHRHGEVYGVCWKVLCHCSYFVEAAGELAPAKVVSLPARKSP